jgi:hypothetical protein
VAIEFAERRLAGVDVRRREQAGGRESEQDCASFYETSRRSHEDGAGGSNFRASPNGGESNRVDQ